MECDFVSLEAEVSNIVPFCREGEKWDVFKGFKVDNGKEVLIVVPKRVIDISLLIFGPGV